jgi:hypothetical protein
MISDLHVDYNYYPGASNSCSDKVCCRLSNGQGDAQTIA